MRSRIPMALLAAVTLAAVGLGGSPAQAAAPRTPDKITSVSSRPGPGGGQVTISWKSNGHNTTSYRIETALTTFSKASNSSLPRTGRHPHIFTVSGSKRSVTLSARQVSSAGAAPNTGNHLFFRVTARNVSKSSATNREYGKLQAVAPRAVTPKSGGTGIRVGSFNVRSAKIRDGRQWLKRASSVARQISSHHPDVMALQELSPGRADGKDGSTAKMPRQTDSLENELKKVGARRYQLVRNLSYVMPGKKHGSQGARILYNTSKLQLLSKCPETTKKRNYNTSCSFDLPIGAGAKESDRRSAAYAEFKNKRTGKRFLFISVHLDHRQSNNLSTLRKYNALRGNQMKTVYAKIGKIKHGNEPVIVAGDFNSWQNNKAGDAPHQYLASKGFYDTAAARTKINNQYDTYNNFKTTVTAGAQGYGNRLDSILVRGPKGSKRYENIMSRVNSRRPSDHNMIITDFTL